MKNSGLRIVATGRALPLLAMSNDDFSKIIDTSDEWIVTRTGIKSRYKCNNESCVSLALDAAKNALAKVNINKNQIGAIIVATSTPDYIFPSVAALVAQGLELDEEVMAFDLSAACTGFLYGLGVANGLLKSQTKPYALVIGSEEMSRITNYEDRSTCILFGDGAGAAIVEKSDNVFYQRSWTRGNVEVLNCKGPGFEENVISMKGNDVFKFAVTVLEQGIRTILNDVNKTMDEIDYVVCHQANARIIAHVSKKFKGYEEKFVVNIEKYGNTSAASIPIALDELMSSGKLKPGMRLLSVGFGAGLSWSSSYIEI